MTPHLEIAWRGWREGVPSPRRVQLELPGWAGEPGTDHAQPWHCKPFVDGNTMGFELLWGLASTVRITGDGTTAVVAGDYQRETGNPATISQFAPGHYGINSQYALKMPAGWGGLVLPHPAFSADPYGSDMPAIVPGLLEFAWWPHLFFVVARVPPAGVTHAFRYGEPFAQVIPVPLDSGDYTLRPMDDDERRAGKEADAFIRGRYRAISTRNWTTGDGFNFGNIYKVLSRRFRRGDAVDWDAVREEYARELDAGPAPQ